MIFSPSGDYLSARLAGIVSGRRFEIDDVAWKCPCRFRYRFLYHSQEGGKGVAAVNQIVWGLGIQSNRAREATASETVLAVK